MSKFDRIIVEYYDMQRGKECAVSYDNPDENTKEFKIEKTVKCYGCTTEAQAIRYARWVLTTESWDYD